MEGKRLWTKCAGQVDGPVVKPSNADVARGKYAMEQQCEAQDARSMLKRSPPPRCALEA